MAGRLALVTTGIQDQWLTGTPEYSLFVSRFRRHTNFAFLESEIPIDGTFQFGNTINCRIPYTRGDLLKNITLRVNIDPPPSTLNADGTRLYCRSFCTELIEYADLLIGGQTIERITGEYIFMHQQLHNTDDRKPTLARLSDGGYVDLPFYFYKNPSLAIPMIALTKQLVELNIKIRPLERLVVNNTMGAQPVIKNISLLCEFIFLTEDEKNYILTRPIEHVITQLQMSEFKMAPDILEKSVMINFVNPVKEFFFVVQNDFYVEKNMPLIFEKIKNVQIRLNNTLFLDAPFLMITFTQPIRHHTNCSTTPSVFGCYSLSIEPEKYYPTGQVNMSRISHKRLTVELFDGIPYEYPNTVRVYALSYNVLRFQSGLGGLKF